jgi:hypothetical protein
VNGEWLVWGVIFTVPLIFGLLSVIWDRAQRRTRSRRRVAMQRSKPEQRADALLKEWLSPEQRVTLQTYGYFEVRGSHTGQRYRIRRSQHMNIAELDQDGVQVALCCFGPVGNLPLGDVMLAQKLALETDEPAALAVANHFRPRGGQGRGTVAGVSGS